jgi:Putative Actinobacterial Holin-X, holin superfamily III
MAVQTERSFAELFQDILANVQEIIRSEFRLAKAEVREEAVKARQSVSMLGAGVFIGLYALGFLLLAAVYGLETVVPSWLAALIVGAAIAVAATVLLSIGRNRLKQVHPVPEKTVATLKENVQWAKHQVR